MASIYTHINENIFSNLKEKHFYIDDSLYIDMYSYSLARIFFIYNQYSLMCAHLYNVQHCMYMYIYIINP